MKQESIKSLSRFNGLNNVADPMRGTGSGTQEHQSWEWQSTAENVNGTDSGGMERREGYTQFFSGSSVIGAFSALNFTSLFVIDAGSLKRIHPDGTALTLYSGLTGTPYWSEINNTVYLSCGLDKLMIEQDNTVAQWGVPVPVQPNVSVATGNLFAGVFRACLTYTDATGREGGACVPVEISLSANGGFTISNIPVLSGYTTQLYATEADGTIFYRVASLPTQTAYTVTNTSFGMELTTQFMDEPPAQGEYITFFGGKAHIVEYEPNADQSYVWFSQPLGFHLFALASDYFTVPGKITQMQGSAAVLLVTTDKQIFVYDGEKLAQVAEYGAVPGHHADIGSDGKIYFWATRGLCRVAPFENMTESRVSVSPGIKAGGTIMERNGYRKFVTVINQGGEKFNARN